VNRCDPPGHAQTEYYPARVTKNLRKNPAISKRPSTRRFFPRVSVAAAGAKTPRRIEPRAADVLPAKAAGSEKAGPRGKPFAAPRAFGKARKTADGKTDPPRTLSATPWAPACAGCLPHYSARLSRISASPGGGPAGRANVACGGVAEWLKAHAWKVCMRETVSRVRIPLPPPIRPRPKFSVGLQARKNPNKHGPSHINLRTAPHRRRPKNLSLRPFFSKPPDYVNLVQNL
jgi:hypothetical protein